MGIVYFDGAFVQEEEARLPFTDRGFLFGDGAYATLQVRRGVPLFFDQHMERLKRQCSSFNLQVSHLSKDSITKLIDLNQASEGIWRLKILATGGDGFDTRLSPRRGRLISFIQPYVPPVFEPLKLGVFPVPFNLCHASFKSLAHLNRFYVMEDACKRGLDDAVTFTESGFILEAAFGNLFWLEGKKMLTPDPGLPLYSGVTISKAIEIGTALGYEVDYVKLKLEEISRKACLFRTNTMGAIRPIAKIESTEFALNSQIQTAFVNAYEELIAAECGELICERLPG